MRCWEPGLPTDCALIGHSAVRYRHAGVPIIEIGIDVGNAKVGGRPVIRLPFFIPVLSIGETIFDTCKRKILKDSPELSGI